MSTYGTFVSTDALDDIVIRCIEKYSIEHRVFSVDPQFSDTEDSLREYNLEAGSLANTILVYGRTDPPKFAACVVLATHKVDVNKSVRQLLGVRKASFASSEQTLEMTNMKLGGVTAIGLPEDLTIYVDEAVMDVDEVLLGGGNRESKLLIPPSEFKKLPNVEIVSVGTPR